MSTDVDRRVAQSETIEDCISMPLIDSAGLTSSRSRTSQGNPSWMGSVCTVRTAGGRRGMDLLKRTPDDPVEGKSLGRDGRGNHGRAVVTADSCLLCSGLRCCLLG